MTVVARRDPPHAETWRLPLFRSGHILVANTAVTAGVGFAFWIAAARLFPPAVVGSNATAVSAMMFLAGLAQLNLMSLLLRFVPAAGPRAGRLVGYAYATGAALSALAAIAFVLGLHLWAPDLAPVLHGPTVIAFVVATAAWSVFVMQDNVLVAVRRAGAVAAENLFFSLAKLVLLVPFAVLLAATGIWYAWAIGTVLAVAGTTAYLFARAIPRFAAETVEIEQTLSWRGFLGYLVPDYFGSLAWIGGTSLVPVLVLDLTDPRHAAAFSLAWQIGFTLFAVPAAFGQSLVAYGATQATDVDADHERVRKHVVLLLAPVSLALIVGAPLLLRLFGPWYADAGTTTLRLVAAAAVPNVVVALAVSHARVLRRMRRVVITLTALCALVLILTVYLVPRVGIAGAGWAWLVGETVVAGALLLPRRIRSATGGVQQSSVHQLRTVLGEGGWTVVGATATVSDTLVLFVRSTGRSAVVKAATTSYGRSLLDHETAVLSQLRADERLGAWRGLLPERVSRSDAGMTYVLDSRLPGCPARPSAELTADVRKVIDQLHHLDRTRTQVSEDLVASWVHRPAAALRAALEARTLPTAGIDALVAELRATVSGRVLDLGWTHGDLHPGNVLVDAGGRVSGLIDWSQASDCGLPELDLAFWLLTSVRGRDRGALGRQVSRRLRSSTPWRSNERAFLADAGQLPDRTVLLLVWLRHVAGNLAKSGRYARSPLWLRRTALPVLEVLS